ncbi:MAG TPA: Ig-like domain-containing protein, partial [Gemmatimonadales bacterium]|nr:Ig-like domain-containing protein [Gemmatimonadales bacterium]
GGPIDRRPVLWATEDPSVATVSAAGLVAGVRPGSATITATVSKKSAGVSVQVIEPISALEVAPSTAILHPRETLQFTATLRGADGGIIEGRPVAWAVSDQDVATVNDAGILTAKRPGTMSVSAEAESEQAVAQLTVQLPVGTVVLSPAGGKVGPGRTLQLEVTLKDENGNSLGERDVAWTSDHPNVAAVSGSGLVSGIRPGRAVVTAKSEEKEGRASITVEEPVARVVVTPGSRRLVTGEEFRFRATPRAADGHALTDRQVEWVSGRPGIAKVSKDGRVTALAAGSVAIEAISEGVDGAAQVEVWEPDDEPVVLVGAGDIATCLGQGDEQTARLLDQIPGVVFTAGDNAYPEGSEADYANCYDPSWGRHKSRTHPVPGNHEYLSPGAQAYFNYFGPAAGDPATGYYSYDLGEWHVLALNTQFTGKEGSPQAEWVKSDLAAHRKKCTLAIYHVPLFGRDSASARMRHVFDLLHKAGAELVINGHEHNYQRYAPQTANGVSDPERGVREFIIGTGGKGVGVGGMPFPNREVAYGGGFGVLKLKLYRESYSWEFVSVPGENFSDRGSTSCH